MAKYEDGILGPLSGKIGPVVASSWRGMPIIKSKPNKSSKPPSAAQLRQRQKMGMISRFLKPMRPIIDFYFGEPEATKSQNNLATAYNIKQAIITEADTLRIDYSKVQLSKGPLTPFIAHSIERTTSRNIHILYPNNKEEGKSKGKDYLWIIAHNAEENITQIYPNIEKRKSGEVTLVLPAQLEDKPVHLWGSYISLLTQKASDSVYLGEF